MDGGRRKYATQTLVDSTQVSELGQGLSSCRAPPGVAVVSTSCGQHQQVLEWLDVLVILGAHVQQSR